MASTYSPGLGIELPGTGDQAGVWGNTTNTNLGTLIEQAISGYVTQAVATGTDTTITIPNGATGVARNMYLELTGTGGASTNLIVPANKKLYFIFNNTSSGQVTVKVSGQTGVSVPNGKKMILVSNGTDIVTAENYVASLSSDNLSLTGNLTLSGGTANGVLYLNGSKVATSGSALVFDGTNLGVGGSPSVKLDVIGGSINTSSFVTITPTTATNNALYRSINTGGTFFSGIDNSAGGVTGTGYAGMLWHTGNYPMVFAVNNAEKMRLTSSVLSTDSSINVGIGTASPSYKLHVVNDTAATNSAVDVLTLTQSSTGTAASGLGAGILFQSERPSGGVILKRGAIYGVAGAVDPNDDGDLAFYTLTDTGPSGFTEKMRLDSSGSLGLNTTTPSSYLSGTAKLVAYANANAQNNILVRNDSNGASSSSALVLNASGNTWGIEIGSAAKNSNALTFQLDYGGANSTLMMLTSSGQLGIGTASPAVKLHVDGGSIAPTSGQVARFDTSATTAYNGAAFVGGTLRLNYGNATSSYGGINFSNFGATSQEFFGVVQNSSGYGNFVWQGFNGSYGERMRLDSSGNLGLGVTPSAWNSGYKATQIKNISTFTASLDANFGSNVFVNSAGNYAYIANGVASIYTQNAGTHVWQYAPSGTANNQITGANAFVQAMTLDASGNLLVGATTGSEAIEATRGGGTSAGLVLNQTGTSGRKYIISSTGTGYGSAGNLIFYDATASQERGRFTSTGDLYVGTTAGDARVTIKTAVDSGAIRIYDSSGGARIFVLPDETYGYQTVSTIKSNGNYALRLENSSATLVGGIVTNASSVSYNTTSDYRLKTLISPITDSGERLDDLNPIEFEWKDSGHRARGFFAHEFQQVYSSSVTGEKDAVDSQGKPVYQAMQASTAEVIADLVAEIQSLRSRVAALEAK